MLSNNAVFCQIITTVAGSSSYNLGDGGAAISGSLSSPTTVALDAQGNMYIADYSHSRIRKVSTSGIITTIAGNGTSGFSGDGGAATAAMLYAPIGVAVDGGGNVYIADYINNRVRKVDASGTITTVAGGGSYYGNNDTIATAVYLNQPVAVATDGAGNFYFSGGNNRVYKVNAAGIMSTIAGGGSMGLGDGGPATSATLNRPIGLALDGFGNIYIADAGNVRIRKIDAAGIITTIAGNGSTGFSGDNGPATNAKLNEPWGLTVDADDNVFFCDYNNSRIRKVSTSGTITTVAGTGSPGFSGDGGPAISAQLYSPSGALLNNNGNLFIADRGNNRIRKIQGIASGSTFRLTFGTPPVNMIQDNGYLVNDVSLANTVNQVSGVATDGITKILLVADNISKPVTFSLSGTDAGKLSDLANQNVFANEVTIEPVNNRVVAIYTPPDSYGDMYREGGREISVKFFFASAPSVYANINLNLVTPPVVLVHGMWSKPAIWFEGGFASYLQQNRFQIVAADYSNRSASSFNPNTPASLPGRNAVEKAVVTALQLLRSKGIAVTQADVVAHSLGGLMTRSWSQQPGFLSKENYKKGFIHKLITIGTPHRGSPFGPELWASQNNVMRIPLLGVSSGIRVSEALAYLDMPIGLCHKDFGVASDAVNALAQTPDYHTHAITANYQDNGSAEELANHKIFEELCESALNHSYDEIMSSTCEGNILEHDLIVPISSQQGYINKTSLYKGVSHSFPAVTTETNTPLLQAKVVTLLLSADTSFFSKGFPAPSSFSPNCTTASQKQSLKKKIKNENKVSEGMQLAGIASPLKGQVFTEGTGATLQLKYSLSGGAKPMSALMILKDIGAYSLSLESPYSMNIQLPDNAPLGNISVCLFIRDSTGLILGDTSHIYIGTNKQPDSVTISPSVIQLDSVNREQPVYVQGYFSNNGVSKLINLSNSSAGTTYKSKSGNSNVFKVGIDGTVTATNPGRDTLIVNISSTILQVPVTVDTNFSEAFKYPNQIDFPSITDKSLTDAPFAVTASSVSGDPVKIELLSGPATLNNGILTINNPGTVLLKASCASTDYFTEAPVVTRTFTVLASAIYTFTGSGNWSDISNWSNNQKPPASLLNGEIIINPAEGGECLLDVPQVVSSPAKLVVAEHKKFRIMGNLIMQ